MRNTPNTPKCPVIQFQYGFGLVVVGLSLTLAAVIYVIHPRYHTVEIGEPLVHDGSVYVVQTNSLGKLKLNALGEWKRMKRIRGRDWIASETLGERERFRELGHSTP